MDRIRSHLPPDNIDIVVYHHPCSDGFAAAYCFWKYNPLITFIPYTHGKVNFEELLKQLTNKNVMFVDLCPSASDLLKIKIVSNKIAVLDHHESSQRILKEVPKLNEIFHLDMTHSGAVLAHHFCFGTKEIPLFIKCVEDRDLWTWKIEITKAFTEVFYNEPFDFERYKIYENERILNDAVLEGNALLRSKEARVERICENSITKTVYINQIRYVCKIVNSVTDISEVGHFLSSDPCISFAVIWYYEKDMIKFSFRSSSTGANVSKIAEFFKGGGHPAASGCSEKFNFADFDKLDEKSAIKTFLF